MTLKIPYRNYVFWPNHSFERIYLLYCTCIVNHRYVEKGLTAIVDILGTITLNALQQNGYRIGTRMYY